MLQSLRLKGRANVNTLAEAWSVPLDTATQALAGLEAEGLVSEKKGFYGLSPAGEEQRQAALSAERRGLDGATLTTLYDEFCAINSIKKAKKGGKEKGKGKSKEKGKGKSKEKGKGKSKGKAKDQ